MTFPTAVALLVALTCPQDQYPGATGSTITLNGISLGMTSAKVVAMKGPPLDKHGMLATDAYSHASWKNCSVSFSFGKVTDVTIYSPVSGTNVPNADATKEEVLKALGEPYERTSSDKLQTDYFEYLNGLQYAFKKGTETAAYVSLSQWSKDRIERDIAAKDRPDYKLTLIDASCVYSYVRNKPERIVSAETNGIVQNNRDRTVTIKVTVTFRDKNGKYLKSDEDTLYSVAPGHKESFSITTFGLYGNAKTNKFSIELEAVND